MNDIKFQFKNHQEKKITAVCMDKDCDKMRLCCYICKGQFHKGHFDKIIEVEQIDDFIQQEKPKLAQFSQQYCYGLNQIVKDLEQLSSLIEYFQKIIKEKLGYFKQQNLSEYLKYSSNKQQGSVYWNQFFEGMLKYVGAVNGSIIINQQNKDQLSKLEERSIKILRQSQQSVQTMIQSLDLFVQTKQLQFQKSPIEMIGHQNTLSQVVISQDGSLIVSGSEDKTVQLWDTNGQTSLLTIQNDSKVYNVAISSTNTYLAYSDSNKFINLYDLKTEKIVWTQKEHTETIRCIIFSQDTQYLLSGGNDNKLIIWSVNENKQIDCYKTDSYIESIIMSQDNKLVSCICFDGGTIYIWDFKTKTQLIQNVKTHSAGFGLCTSVDSQIYISSGADGLINIWKLNESKDQRTLTLTQSIQAANKPIDKVILTPDDLYIISSCNSVGQIMIHELETRKLIQVLQSTESYYHSFISMSNDMNRLVSSNCLDMTFRVWTRE